jgi:surface polysaccharide O-acyltransferase-like enzyme
MNGPGPARLVPIDVLKGVGILVVLWIHTVGDVPSPTEWYLLELTRCAVPGFLAASGYLYATREPVRFEKTRGRLQRVLVPYLIASALAQLYWWAIGTPHSWLQIGRDLAYGASFGPYYFVFLITVMIVATPLFARIPAALMAAIWIFFVAWHTAALAAVIAHPAEHHGSLFWVLRDPSLWGIYFVGGWVASLYRKPLAGMCTKYRVALIAISSGTALVLSILAVRIEAPVIAALAGWLNTLVMIAVVALVSFGVPRLPRAVSFLSDTSYTFYLYHLFFVFTVLRHAPAAAHWGVRLLVQLTAVAAGLVGSGLVLVGAHRALGARARTIVGG